MNCFVFVVRVLATTEGGAGLLRRGLLATTEGEEGGLFSVVARPSVSDGRSNPDPDFRIVFLSPG